LERAVTRRKPLSPVVGQSNPGFEGDSSTQKIMLLIITVGFIVLTGLLLYLPFMS
jgi:hypothetical protein